MASLTRRTTFVGALWNVAAMIFPLISTLLLSVVIGRRLGSAALGQQSVIAYMGGLVGGLVVIAATNCATQVLAAAAGAPGRFAAMARLSRRVHLVGGLLAGLVLATIGSTRDLAWAWVLIGLVTFIDALGWAHASRLIGLEGWRAVSPLRLVSQVAGTLLGVGAIVLDLGLPGVFAAQALASTWLTVMLRRRDRRHRPDLDIAPVPLVMRPLVRLWSLYAVGALLTQVVNKRIELVFLDAFRSPHEVAVYAVAFTVISVAVTVPSSLMGAALPGISAADAAGNETELHGHLHRAARLAILGGFLLTAGLVVLGPYLVLALWGGQFTAAARIVPWLAVAMLGTPLGVLLDVYWTAVNRLGAVLVTGAVSAVVDLGLAAALVPSLGVPGAVTANLAGQLTWLAGLIVYTRRRIPGLLPPASFLGRCAASALAAGAAAWAAAALLGGLGAFVGLVGGGLAFLAALALLGRTLGLVAAPDLEWLGGLLPTVARPLLAALGGRTSARQEHGPGSDQPVVTSSR